MSVEQTNEGYRSFARGGIAAVIAINTLALGAVLSQLAELRAVADQMELARAFYAWIAGVVLGVPAWIAAALASQAFASGARVRERCAAAIGYFLFFASLGCFAYGAHRMAIGALLQSGG
ncbi:MAG: hypothetical protein ACU0AX_02575 [Roseovarius sp.]|uniref:hypothetical protein n=1 Tax=Roseovarius sp. TaxID=1486281 RepID=UPI004059C310